MPCLAHGGTGPNLAITDAPDGRVLFYCHSHGCTHAEIAEAIADRGIDLGIYKRQPITPEIRRERQAAAEIQRRQAERDAANAAKRAQRMMEAATYDVHPYLAAKGFPDEQAWVLDGKLLIPMRDHRTDELRSVQVIDEQGDKKFLRGGRAGGTVMRLGTRRTMHTWHVEGYASALSLKAALARLYRRDEIRVTFSAGNMPKVAVRPGFAIADNDASGTGLKYAKQTGLPVWMPKQIGTDINDLHVSEGLDAVVDAMRELIRR